MDVKRSQQVPRHPIVDSPAPRMLEPFPSTFPQLLARMAHPHGERVFLPRRRATEPQPVTFAELLQRIDRLARGLLALGIRRGDRVGLVAENRCEWLLVDLALASIGAVDVPRGSDTTPTELQFILQHSGCRMVFADDERVAAEVLAMRGSLPQLERVAVMQPTTTLPGALGLDAITDAAAARPDLDALDAARATVATDDLLTIVYTSGTTAEPKGVMLTHGNVLSNIEVVTSVLDVTPGDRFLSVLPAWHMYERIMDYVALACGSELIYTDRRRIKDDLLAVRPTVFAAVPRIWEMLHDGVVNHSLKQNGLAGRLLRRSLLLSRLVGGGRASLWQRLQHRLLDVLVLQKVRRQFGGALRLCVSGGGALPRHVDETLLGMGLPLRNGYGLTETSPVACLRLPHQHDPGHIGPPLPRTQIQPRRDDGSECAVGETGVLWIRGPQVMRGYYENARRTAEVLTHEGWFNSGDLGHRDARGNLWITGRAKDTIVLAGGENVEPEPIETLIKTSPFVEQAVCVGQDQKALGALIVPMFDALEHAVPREQWSRQGDELTGRPVLALFRRELDRLLVRENGCRSCDRVAAVRVLAEPMTAENGLLTQTLKVRRHVVQQRFAPLLATMFGGQREA